MRFQIRHSGVMEIRDLNMEIFRLMIKLTRTRSSRNIKKLYKLNIFMTTCKVDSTSFPWLQKILGSIYILILRDYIFPWSRDEVGENWRNRSDKECSCPVVTLSYCNSTILPIQQAFQWAMVKSISYILFIFTEMSYHLSESGRSAARTVHIP